MIFVLSLNDSVEKQVSIFDLLILVYCLHTYIFVYPWKLFIPLHHTGFLLYTCRLVWFRKASVFLQKVGVVPWRKLCTWCRTLRIELFIKHRNAWIFFSFKWTFVRRNILKLLKTDMFELLLFWALTYSCDMNNFQNEFCRLILRDMV